MYQQDQSNRVWTEISLTFLIAIEMARVYCASMNYPLPLPKKKKTIWKEKLERESSTVSRWTNEIHKTRNKPSIIKGGGGCTKRIKFSCSSTNNTLNFPLCNPPHPPLNSNIQINQSSSGVPCTFPAQRSPPNFRSLLHYTPPLISLLSLYSLSFSSLLPRFNYFNESGN